MRHAARQGNQSPPRSLQSADAVADKGPLFTFVRAPNGEGPAREEEDDGRSSRHASGR